MDALYDYYFVHHEWNYLIDYLGTATTHVFSVNDREKSKTANNKMTQLRIAAECGFEIPQTLISNDFDTIVEFVSRFDGKSCVFKTFTPYISPSGFIAYTTLIDISLLNEKRRDLIVAPGLFQEFVEKSFELRITIVGGDVFAARVNSRYSSNARIDWRREISSDIYDKYELDNGFLEKLLDLHSKLGLFYAAYDFIIDETGNPVFLEVNPSGQWMWLELRLGFPIGERIALALANPPQAV